MTIVPAGFSVIGSQILCIFPKQDCGKSPIYVRRCTISIYLPFSVQVPALPTYLLLRASRSQEHVFIKTQESVKKERLTRLSSPHLVH